jgi:hypothetical protein
MTEDFVSALDSVKDAFRINFRSLEEFEKDLDWVNAYIYTIENIEVYHLICFVILHQQNTNSSVAKSSSHLIKYLLLADNDSLGTIMTSICTQLAKFLGIEYHCEFRRLERLEDPSNASRLFGKPFVIEFPCQITLLLLCWFLNLLALLKVGYYEHRGARV